MGISLTKFIHFHGEKQQCYRLSTLLPFNKAYHYHHAYLFSRTMHESLKRVLQRMEQALPSCAQQAHLLQRAVHWPARKFVATRRFR